MKESELYPPVKRFLEALGYEVKGEVGPCDVMALREDDPPLVVELKPALNLALLLQAVDRLSLTPMVYLGVPNKCRIVHKQRRRVIKLLRMLGLGLLVVDTHSKTGRVDVVLDPGPYTPRLSKKRQARLLGEFSRRVGDPNPGGADRRKGLMTAYRQRALAIAGYLQENGPVKAAQVARELEEPKARDILYRNVYGWFERPARGVYRLSKQGAREIRQWQKEAQV